MLNSSTGLKTRAVYLAYIYFFYLKANYNKTQPTKMHHDTLFMQTFIEAYATGLIRNILCK